MEFVTDSSPMYNFYIEKTTFTTVLPFCGQDGQATELM